jgi:preprotein translocase subunit SecE
MTDTQKTNPVAQYLAESKSELQKVTWPNRQAVVKHTLLVLGLCVALAIFIGVVDFGLNKLFELIVK